jgi:simple sugar transport system substrate-binding protein
MACRAATRRYWNAPFARGAARWAGRRDTLAAIRQLTNDNALATRGTVRYAPHAGLDAGFIGRHGSIKMNIMIRLALAALLSAGLFGLSQAAGLKEAKDVRITFVVHGSPSDAYWSVVKRGVDDAAALTGAKVEYYAPQVFDVVEQARLMEAAIATKPDGIAVSIADADALKKSVTSALAANIPVVVVDSGEKQGIEMGTTLYVGTVSEYDSGKKAGERLAKEGTLKVVCINHEVGNISLDERCQGLNDGLKPSGGGTEVVAVSPDPADIQRRTEAYLSAHSDVQGVFAMGASAANALIPMFRKKELFGKLRLYTFDISPEVLDSVVAGEMGFGMDAQQYLMGYLPVIHLVEQATHGFWPQNNFYTGPLFIDTPEKAKAILTLAKEGIR